MAPMMSGASTEAEEGDARRQHPLRAESVDHEPRRDLGEARHREDDRHHEPELGVAHLERVLDEREQGRQRELEEMARSVGETDERHDAEVAGGLGRGFGHASRSTLLPERAVSRFRRRFPLFRTGRPSNDAGPDLPALKLGPNPIAFAVRRTPPQQNGEEPMLKRILGAGLAALAGVALAATPAAAQTLDKIKQRGVLVVGTKADYKPFGFRDPSGAIVGFEPDLAKDVADKLGVKLELEPVVSSNRMQFLQQGKIDLMIATMNDKPDRRQVVGIVEPLYYASGVNVLASKKAGLKSWEQLKGQKVCGIQGAWYNKPVAEKYGADIVAFKGQSEAETALMQGNCIGWVYDDTAFAERLADAKWKDFEMPLETILEEPWGIAVKLEERDGPWGKFVSETIADWHRSGRLIELEKKWNIPPSAYLKKMQAEAKPKTKTN
jgi:polar amino acid transport system substrate-binding protein